MKNWKSLIYLQKFNSLLYLKKWEASFYLKKSRASFLFDEMKSKSVNHSQKVLKAKYTCELSLKDFYFSFGICTIFFIKISKIFIVKIPKICVVKCQIEISFLLHCRSAPGELCSPACILYYILYFKYAPHAISCMSTYAL